MGIDILDLIDARGGDAEAVRESQRRRNASVELVDECIGMYEARTKRQSVQGSSSRAFSDAEIYILFPLVLLSYRRHFFLTPKQCNSK